MTAMTTSPRPIQDDYHVALDTFKGPMDLLLFLIRRAEVDITDIPIAVITDQYLEFLRHIDSIDIDLAGEFLVMAATLVELKSRILQKQRDRKRQGEDEMDVEGLENLADDLDAADPRYELVQQLLAYQRYRMAAEDLDHRRDEFALRYPVRPGTRDDLKQTDAIDEEDDPPSEVDLDDANVFELFDAYQRIIDSVDFSRLGEHEVEYDDTPIGLHQDDLLDRLQRAESRRVTLQEAWLGRRKIDVIGLFLATLELVRQRRVIVVQDDIRSEIMLELNVDPDEPQADVTDDGGATEVDEAS